MLNYVTSVLLLTVAVARVDNFVFPDEASSRSLTGYDEDDYDNSNIYGNYPFGHDNVHHPEYSGSYDGNNRGFVPAFGNNQGYNSNERDRRPNYGGIVSQSQANAQSTGIDSTANSQSSSQFLNNFSQSNAHAGSQGYQPISSYPHGSSGNSGASSASSAASATSGIVNGFPVASASAAAASSGDSSSASSSSSSSGGFVDRPGQPSPWYFRGRISGDDSDGNDDSSSTGADDDGIIFPEK